MFFNQHSSLKKVYYRSFMFLIVIPILTIFSVVMGILRMMMRFSEIETIQAFQDNIVSTLEEDIREASLQLSHFVYVNEGEFLDLAGKMNTSDVEKRYEYRREMDRAFHTAMVPKQDIIGGMFYMKQGGSVYMKEEIILEKAFLREEEWYRRALENPDIVSVGSYDTDDTRLVYSIRNGWDFVLVTAMSPSRLTDKSDKVEMVTFFTISKIGNAMRAERKNERLGKTVIVDSSNQILYGDFGEVEVSEHFRNLEVELKPGIFTERNKNYPQGPDVKYTYVVKDIAGTDWKAVSYIETSALVKNFNKTALLGGVVICMLFGLFYIFSKYFLRNIVIPVHTMVEGLRQVEEGNLDTHIEPEGQSEIRNMIHSFNRMVRQLKTTNRQKEEAQQKKHEAEVKALQSQINPHFLVNTLNSIRFMAQVSKFDGIRKMAEALIKIVSCSFRSNISFYTVREELEVLDSYIYLMKIRYSEGFEVSYEIDEESLGYYIPRLILQPVVENSIVHGFTELDEEIGQILIKVRKKEEKLYLTVEDNGKGMTEEEIDAVLNGEKKNPDDNSSIGLKNVFTRLKLNFSSECSMQMESEPGKYTRTCMILPLIQKDVKQTGGE